VLPQLLLKLLQACAVQHQLVGMKSILIEVERFFDQNYRPIGRNGRMRLVKLMWKDERDVLRHAERFCPLLL